MDPVFTTGEISQETNVPVWKILAAIRRKYLPEPARVGKYRVWPREDLPRIREALQRAGYLPAAEVQHAG